jgi:hypothetical protein
MLLPYSGFQFLFFLGEYPSNLWTLPTFSEASNMSREDLTAPVDAAATAQVKLCPYDEEEPHIWFCLIEAEFATAGIKSQKLKYANALASLPKQVLWDILDTLDVCNDSAEPFIYLKNTLLRQFGKSKWQSYFELHFASPWKCRASNPVVLSWGSSTNISLQEFLQTTIFSFPCF